MLRRATRRDLDALFAVETVCFGDRRYTRETIAWILDDVRAATIVDDRDGIVGSIMVQVERDASRVISVAVLPDWRRQGIGRSLMTAAEEFARGRGAGTIRLEVGVDNAPAVEFYKTLGYRIDGVLPAYYRDGGDGYAMAKRLEANA